MLDAYNLHGREAARKTFAGLAHSDRSLVSLLAADDSTGLERFAIHWAKEALGPQPERDWVIEGLIAAGDVAILVGEAGTKKTYLSLDAGICVSHGLPWLGFDTGQGTVLVVDEESGPERLNRRLGQLMRAHDAGADTPLAYVSLQTLNLREEDEANALGALIEKTGARLVIIDALADVMLGADENNVRDVQPVFHRLRTLASRYRCAFVVIHHANKAGGYRGSSAIKGAVDLMLYVENKPDSPVIEITAEKCRDDLPPKRAAHIDFRGDSVVITEADVANSPPTFGKAQRYVLRYLRDHGPSLMMDIKAHADMCTARSARDAVYSLTEQGLTERVDPGGQGVEATYALTAKGKKVAVTV